MRSGRDLRGRDRERGSMYVRTRRGAQRRTLAAPKKDFCYRHSIRTFWRIHVSDLVGLFPTRRRRGGHCRGPAFSARSAPSPVHHQKPAAASDTARRFRRALRQSALNIANPVSPQTQVQQGQGVCSDSRERPPCPPASLRVAAAQARAMTTESKVVGPTQKKRGINTTNPKPNKT